MILVLAPLWMEAFALRKGLGGAGVVVRTGMGRAHALAAAGRAREVQAGAVVLAGVGGAVDPDLRPGDVVVGTHASAADGSLVTFELADELAEAIRTAGVRVVTGAIASSPSIVGPAERFLLRGRATAVDMESAWVGGAAAGRPLGSVRVIVDSADRSLRDPRTLVSGVQALRQLHRIAPALATWAEGAAANDPSRVGFTRVPLRLDPMTRLRPFAERQLASYAPGGATP